MRICSSQKAAEALFFSCKVDDHLLSVSRSCECLQCFSSSVFLPQVSAPYLRSEYGKDYDYDSPVKLLDILLHGKCKRADQQVVVLGHVLAADCTIGYEDLQNYQVPLVRSPHRAVLIETATRLCHQSCPQHRDTATRQYHIIEISHLVQVFAVNGKKLNKLKDLVDIVDSCKSEFLRFDLEYDATVIIETEVARAATKDIMSTHCIAFDRSNDLRS